MTQEGVPTLEQITRVPPSTESTGSRLARELRERRPERIPRIIAELTRRIEERQVKEKAAA